MLVYSTENCRTFFVTKSFISILVATPLINHSKFEHQNYIVFASGMTSLFIIFKTISMERKLNNVGEIPPVLKKFTNAGNAKSRMQCVQYWYPH